MPDDQACLGAPRATSRYAYPAPGERFERLVAVSRAPNGPRGHVRWNCLCDCGKDAVVAVHLLRRATTRSCGCLKQERMGAHLVRHGAARRRKLTPEFVAWRAAKQRVTDAAHPDYHRYGGRGIGMAPEFLSSFEAFLAYMGPKPSPKHSLDRIDGDKGYERGNMRWATATEQSRNRAYVTITAELAEEIRGLAGVVGQREIAVEFGISKTQVGRIIRGEAWVSPK